MAITIPRIIPSLKLRQMTDGAIGDYAAQRVTSLTANDATFGGITPSAADVNLVLVNFNSALAQTGVDGTPSDTSIKNAIRMQLEIILMQCANACSDVAAGDEGVFLLSGFGIKSKPTRVTSLETPTNLRFMQGSMDGTMMAKFKGVKNAGGYEVCCGTNPATPDSWTMFSTSKGSPVMITDLTSMTVCYGRCRAIGSRGIKSDWSAVVEFKVM